MSSNIAQILDFLTDYVDISSISDEIKANYDELYNIAQSLGYIQTDNAQESIPVTEHIPVAEPIAAPYSGETERDNDSDNDSDSDSDTDIDNEIAEKPEDNKQSSDDNGNSVVYENWCITQDISIYSVVELDDYYKNIPEIAITFWATNANFTLIPRLPKTLDSLIMYDNCISEIECILPTTLKNMCVDRNCIANLPDNMPDSIEYLSISYNKLTLVDILPANLIMFGASYNNIYQMNMLPGTLQKCIVNNNEISYIPKLPETMEVLKIHNNEFEEYPYLNEGLKLITCHNNPIYNKMPKKVRKMIDPIQQYE